MNGPPRGFNVINDQSSYDLVYRDIIINSNLGSLLQNVTSYSLGTDSINQIYKAELISATVAFESSIPANIVNNSILLSIPQLNGNTCRIAGNINGNGTSSSGNNSTQGSIFAQIPDNSTPLHLLDASGNNSVISLLVGPHMYESIQFYNPPISKLNTINVSWYDQYANIVTGIKSFYFTLRIHYFQKRYSSTSFSTSVNISPTNNNNSLFNPGG